MLRASPFSSLFGRFFSVVGRTLRLPWPHLRAGCKPRHILAGQTLLWETSACSEEGSPTPAEGITPLQLHTTDYNRGKGRTGSDGRVYNRDNAGFPGVFCVRMNEQSVALPLSYRGSRCGPFATFPCSR